MKLQERMPLTVFIQQSTIEIRNPHFSRKGRARNGAPGILFNNQQSTFNNDLFVT